MSTIDERKAYLENPFFKKHIYGDFTPFYATIAVCTAICTLLIIFNIICCTCSKYRHYWQDRHTGNRWLVSIWSATPHKQPPLDFTELKYQSEIKYVEDVEQPEYEIPYQPQHHQRTQLHEQVRQQLQAHRSKREEYVELQKRESDI